MHKLLRTIALFAGILFYAAFTLRGQEPLWGLYWNNQSLMNPALSGFGIKSQAYIQNRAQWLGIPNGGNSIVAAYDMNESKLNGGIGANYLYDKIGAIETQAVQLNYNYQFQLKEDLNILVQFV